MLSIRPYQRCTNSAVNSRMNPPRQISSTRFSSSADCSLRLERRAILAERLAFDDDGRDAGGLRLRKPAGIRAVGNHDDDLGRKILRFCSLDQRGHVRSAPGDQDGDAAFMASPPQIEMAVIDHAVFASGLDHLAQQRNALAASRENVDDLLDRRRARRSRSCRCRS